MEESSLPNQGESFTWSPDSKNIAFISATPGPETQEANGHPIVITRFLYKPTASEGLTHFNDNRRLHMFFVDIATKQVRQLTDGIYDEHSIDWSPDGQEILFVSNREPNADEFFNYDVFALKMSDHTIRRITATEGCEYAPRWAPDGKSIAYLGTKRGLTDRETTMEDTHVWVMDVDGTQRRELGAVIDNREEALEWAPDGAAVYFTYQERGSSRLARLPISEARPEILVNSPGLVGDYSVGRHGEIAYALETPHDMAQLYVKTAQTAAHQLSFLNAGVLMNKPIAEVESFTFILDQAWERSALKHVACPGSA